MNAVEIKNLSCSYPDGTLALSSVNLEIPKFKRIALLGANGSGKTTLLYHLNGLIIPQKGSVEVLDRKVSKKELKNIRHQVGMVFENPDDQLICTTVAEDIAFGPRNAGMDEKNVGHRVQKAMETVNICDLAERSPYNLSLGQKKRAALAGVLAMETEILVLDEAFSGLDPSSVRQLILLLKKLHAGGCTVILTTHDVDLAYKWADKVVILSEGKLIAEGTVDILRDKDLMEKAYLEVPALVNIFKGTGMYPRTLKEANDILLYGEEEGCKIAKSESV